ncbi:hypothetical protein AB6A40_009003 [Gnathostoma spinigerum]|uniref:Uncharacterized protein n=1 Tax=Gnathostoma spinigerum TaxID=75299 RepID=A0ABD6EYG5_9BILA
MDLVQSYADSSDGASSDAEEELMRKPLTLESCKSLALKAPALDVAPFVETKADLGVVVCVDPNVKELAHNPRYEELFQAELCKMTQALAIRSNPTVKRRKKNADRIY